MNKSDEAQNCAKVVNRVLPRLISKNQKDSGKLATLRTVKEVTNPRANLIWPVLLNELSSLSDYDGKANYSARAVYEALHLFAIYQQGQIRLMYTHEPKDSLMKALRTLRMDPSLSNFVSGFDRQAQRTFEANNWIAVQNALRRLISMMKAHQGQPINFGRLASDLYWLQINDRLRRDVLFKWGNEYYQLNKQLSEKDK